MKKNNLKRSVYLPQIQGFTLVEVLMAITILGVTSSLITYALSQMITTNQGLAQEQNRRVEISRALDLIANDIKISKVYQLSDPARPIPAAITTAITADGGAVILDMDIIAGSVTNNSTSSSFACADNSKNRIIYLIKPANSSETQFSGPNIIYRYGLVSNSDGNINCNDSQSTSVGFAIADGLSIANNTKAITAPTCGTIPNNFGGFYTCLSENDSKIDRVSIAMYGVTRGVKNGSNYNITKTYAINRNIRSGEAPTVVNNSSDWCTVPNVVSQTTTEANSRIAAALNTDTTKTTPNGLLANAISTELTADNPTVINQTPAAGSQLPCSTGLVTYTY